jgi:formylglycine-generating enzyme required for sulfatase activity
MSLFHVEQLPAMLRKRNHMNRSQEWIISTLLLVVLVFAGCSSYTPPDFVLVQGGPGGDFYISATEVTFDQYDAFCDATGYKKPRADFGRGNQPVINVNAADAIAYCEWLSKETGTTIRLPEENEWEFAAKGGMRSNGYQYSGGNSIDDVAWHKKNSGAKAHEVATKDPNELGLYDMSGNVW